MNIHIIKIKATCKVVKMQWMHATGSIVVFCFVFVFVFGFWVFFVFVFFFLIWPSNLKNQLANAQ